MFKFGFSDISQFSKKTDFRGFFGGQKKISVTLYENLKDCPDREVIEEQLLMFFADVHGTYKRTSCIRFADFDRDMIEQMVSQFSPSETIFIEDVAVSSARTSYEFFTRVSEVFPQIYMNGTDYDPYFYVVEEGRIRLSFSSKGTLLEIVCPPFVFNEIKRDSYLYFLNHLVRAAVKLIAVRPLLAAYKSREKTSHRVPLFCQEALTLAGNDERFTLGQHDILKPFIQKIHFHEIRGTDSIETKQFKKQHSPSHHSFSDIRKLIKQPKLTTTAGNCNVSVIRAMNVLNLDYFRLEEIQLVLINIFDALCEGGLFGLGSNSGPGTVVNGGIFQKLGNRFKVLKLSGDGPHIQILQMIKSFNR